MKLTKYFFALLLIQFCFGMELYAQSTFVEGFIKGLTTNKKNSTTEPKKKIKLPEIKQPYHIPFSDMAEQKRIEKKGKKNYYSYSGFTFSLSLQCGIPIGDFKKHTLATGYGLAWGLAYQPSSKAPLSIGLDMNYMMYGLDNRKLYFPFTITSGSQVVGSYAVPLYANTKNHMFATHGSLRLWAPTKYVQPYLIGMGGFQYISTKTKFYDNDHPPLLGIKSDGVVFEQRIIGSITYSAGGGIGLWMNLGDLVNLDIRASYLTTGNAKYFDHSDTQNWQFNYTGSSTDLINNDIHDDRVKATVQAQPKQSHIDMIFVNVGIQILFD